VRAPAGAADYVRALLCRDGIVWVAFSGLRRFGFSLDLFSFDQGEFFGLGLFVRWLYACAINSFAFFDAAYRLIGWSTLS